MVAALGYFVDVFDILLFSVVRKSSLLSIGVPEADLLSVGVRILNFQNIGMLIGGLLWGVWGDRRGRLSVLFGSILLYSLATLANAFVQTPEQYAWLRFVAGLGLAGELGAGIALVTEILPQNQRGIGTMLVSTVGVAGGLVAAVVGKTMDWKNAYLLAGLMGLSLLLMRMSVRESSLFEKHKDQPDRGNLLRFFSDGRRTVKFIASVLTGVPIYFVLGVLVTFAPEIGKAKGLSVDLSVADAVFYSYIGFILGDFFSGMTSQLLKSRKKALYLFIAMCGFAGYSFLTQRWETPEDANFYYASLGLFAGYWAVLVTVSAEQFGVNYRSTAGTLVPNLVRASVVPLTLFMKQQIPQLGMITVCVIALISVITLALFSILYLEETFSKNMDYIEGGQNGR
jgi:putative MFS transporter